MEHYEIIITPDAITDLTELRDYISGALLVPDVALKYVQAIRREIASLDSMPARIAPVPEEPWHSHGIRRMLVKNFYVYYRIDEERLRVYILNVIYAKRDQLKALAEFL